jgi:hypothetical protein
MAEQRAHRATWGSLIFACSLGTLLLALTLPSLAWGADFTWSGGASVGSPNWSTPSNWEGGVTPSGSVGTLTFPPLPDPPCRLQGEMSTSSTSTCYESNNDLSGLQVNALSLDDGYVYRIGGNPITLGAGGLTADTAVGNLFDRTASLEVNMPIVLGASQAWTVDGNGFGHGLELHGDLSGESKALDIELKSSNICFGGSDSEVGPIEVTGEAESSFESYAVLCPTSQPSSLNAADGHSVKIVDAGFANFGEASIGPLSMTGGLLEPGGGNPPGPLQVNGGVTLSSATRYIAPVGRPETAVDYSQLRASGEVDLANSQLLLSNDALTYSGGTPTCEELKIGDVYTLLSTSGTLHGTFAGVPDGAVETANCSSSVEPPNPATMEINYTAQSVTATVLTGLPPTHTLTTTLAGSGSGTVDGAGIHCPGTCSKVYPKGTQIALTATPEPGSTFLGWSGGGCGGSGACTVTMDADQNVTAEFSASSSSSSGNGPTPPPVATCRDSSETIGPFTIKAACFVNKGGKLVARGRVRINGVDIVPAGSGSITVDPRALTLSSSGEVGVYLGSIKVYHHSLSWKLQGSLTLELPAGVTVKGVPVAGKLELRPSAAKGGLMQVGANAQVGPITGSMQLELTNALGLQMQNATLSWEGELPLKQLVVKSATLRYEHTAAGDEWTGEVAVKLPDNLPELDGRLALLNGKIAEVGLAASRINKPIGAIVYLQKIGLDVRVVPHIKATGELALSAGPELPIVDAPAASLEGTLTADLGSPFVLSASGHVVIAGKLNLASATAKWTVPSRFELSGEAKISAGPASVDARISGIVASNGFSLFGNGAVSIPGASGNGIVYFSEKGFGACVMESVGPVTVAEGFGVHWRLEFPSLWFDSCGLEDYKSKALASSSRLPGTSVIGEAIQVPAGQEQVLIGARGVDDFPAFSVESPGGQLIDPTHGVSGPVEGGGYRFVSDPPHLGTYVILAHPKSGIWRIIPNPGSPQIASYGRALGAPPLGIEARAQRGKGGYVLNWRATPIHGEEIRFSEVSSSFARALKTTSKASGALRFKPADPYSGGRRTIEALISVDGLPRKIARVTFQVPRRRLPKIRRLRIERRGNGALIRWQPVQGVALDLWVQLSDGRRLFFRLPPGAHSQRVLLLPWTKRAMATISPVAPNGRSGPRSRSSSRL